MFLQSAEYTINISVETNCDVESLKDIHSYAILNPDNLTLEDIPKVFFVTVKTNNKTTNYALVGDSYSCEENCAVLNNETLTVLQDSLITQINLSNQSVRQQDIQKLIKDEVGCYFGIFICSAGYVIYGEINVVMLDSQLNLLWSFSGSDIFVSQDNSKKAFEIYDGRIKLYDWNENYYELDFDGNLIKETAHK